MKKKTATYIAAGLIDDCTHAEYVRGICELLAYAYPKEDVDTQERVAWFEHKIWAQVKVNEEPYERFAHVSGLRGTA